MKVAGRHIAGWRKQRPDHRDHVMAAPSILRALSLPRAFDLAPQWVRIENQGEIGSCTANASTSCLEFLWRKIGKPVAELSRLFVYYATRVWVEHVAASDDSGAVIRDVMRALVKYGACPERTWPYAADRFGDMPSDAARREASKHQLLSSPVNGRPGYSGLRSLVSIKQSIADGYPVVGGFSVPESMMSAAVERTGIVALPGRDEAIVGGHAVAFVGYNDDRRLLKFANSWGAGWGRGGFGFLPYAYVDRGLADDFWTMRHVEGA